MYPSSHLPPPLPTQAFYILLALSIRTELHAYALKGAVQNDSLGSVRLTDSRMHALLQKLHDEGHIELAGTKPTEKSSKLSMHYRISEEGLIRLKEELARLQHAVKTGENAGLLKDQTPFDIQRLIVRRATIES